MDAAVWLRMNISLADQLRALLLALALGALTGLLYDLFRPPRRRTGPAAAALLDILFCLLAGSGAFLYAMSAGSGRLGLWDLTGMLLGFLLYMNSLSPPLLRLFTAELNVCAHLMERCKKRINKLVISAKNRFQNMRE